MGSFYSISLPQCETTVVAADYGPRCNTTMVALYCIHCWYSQYWPTGYHSLTYCTCICLWHWPGSITRVSILLQLASLYSCLQYVVSHGKTLLFTLVPAQHYSIANHATIYTMATVYNGFNLINLSRLRLTSIGDWL